MIISQIGMSLQSNLIPVVNWKGVEAAITALATGAVTPSEIELPGPATAAPLFIGRRQESLSSVLDRARQALDSEGRWSSMDDPFRLNVHQVAGVGYVVGLPRNPASRAVEEGLAAYLGIERGLQAGIVQVQTMPVDAIRFALDFGTLLQPLRARLSLPDGVAERAVRHMVRADFHDRVQFDPSFAIFSDGETVVTAAPINVKPRFAVYHQIGWRDTWVAEGPVLRGELLQPPTDRSNETPLPAIAIRVESPSGPVFDPERKAVLVQRTQEIQATLLSDLQVMPAPARPKRGWLRTLLDLLT